MRGRTRGWIALLILGLFARGAWAVPANPFPATIVQPDGTRFVAVQRGDEFRHWMETKEGYALTRDASTGYWEFALRSGDALRASGVVFRASAVPPSGAVRGYAPKSSAEAWRAGAGKGTKGATWTPQPISGARTILLLRVGCLNRPLGTAEAIWGEALFGATSSVAKYYSDQSGGRLTIRSALGGSSVLTVALGAGDANGGNHPDGFIDVGDEATQHQNEVAFVTSVLAKAAAAGFDFASTDTDGDGRITPSELCVYLIVAGYEESAGSGLTPAVWAHAWNSWTGQGAAHQVTVAGKVLSDWAMNGEYYDATNPMPFGVIAHELGHQFCGLPDLYDTSQANEGLGNFSLMAAGSWGAQAARTPGSCPVNLDAWSRQYLGWETPVSPASGTVTLGTPANGTHPAIKLFGAGHRSTEYFLAEVRSLTGWDAGLERFGTFIGLAGGLLVLHVDEEVGSGSLSAGNDFNTTTAGGHQGCMALEADGPHLSRTDGMATRGSQYTLWYSGNPNYVGDGTLTDGSNPSTGFYDGSASGVALRGISAGGTLMTCVVASGGTVPTPTPSPLGAPSITEFSVSDTRPDPGDSVRFTAAATDPRGGSLTYRIDFGDGYSVGPLAYPSGTRIQVDHTYLYEGDYTARLTVTNGAGTVSQPRTIEVTYGSLFGGGGCDALSFLPGLALLLPLALFRRTRR